VAVRDGPVDDGLTAVDGHEPDSGTVVDGGWIIEIHLEERAAERWTCPPRREGNSPPEVGDVHNHPRLSTESTRLSTRKGPGRAFACRPPSAEGRLVRVDQLADRGDLAPQLIVDGRLAGDLVAGMEDGRVVPATQLGADPQQRDVGLLAH
jgi:hypothetical protein